MKPPPKGLAVCQRRARRFGWRRCPYITPDTSYFTRHTSRPTTHVTLRMRFRILRKLDDDLLSTPASSFAPSTPCVSCSSNPQSSRLQVPPGAAVCRIAAAAWGGGDAGAIGNSWAVTPPPPPPTLSLSFSLLFLTPPPPPPPCSYEDVNPLMCVLNPKPYILNPNP